MMSVKVTAKTITIEIDKAVHVFARHALLGVRLQDAHGPLVTPTGRVSIALAGGAAIEAVLLMDEARRLLDLLTQAMEGDGE